MSAMLPLSLRAFAATSVPVGLELYSVRNALKDDLSGYSSHRRANGIPVRRILCAIFRLDRASDQRDEESYWTTWAFAASRPTTAAPISLRTNSRRRADMNLILGSKYVMMSSSQPKPGLDGWKEVADTLNSAADQLAPSGLKTGYHNHELEFTPVDGKRPIEILAKNTKPSVALQFDIGTCLEAGSDPVAWIRANPGRIKSIHCKDWAPGADKGYTVLFGEGAGGLEGNFRRSRKRWRDRILSGRTGGQQVLRIRYGEEMPGDIPETALLIFSLRPSRLFFAAFAVKSFYRRVRKGEAAKFAKKT